MPPRWISQGKVVLCTVVFLVLSVSALHADGKGPIIPKGKGEQCVAETDFMRRNHMDLINHQRDETVIRGIRSEPFSLVECVECHVQREADNTPIRIDAKDQFCASCHAFVAAKIDCFTCHAATPDSESNARFDKSFWQPNNRHIAMVRRAFSTPDIAQRLHHDESRTVPKSQ